jgi:fructose-1,6-bisphosphatase/inositol monophosphatase family enzyme
MAEHKRSSESTENELPLAELKGATIDAAIASMLVVHKYQMGEAGIQQLDDKEDKSILTVTDLESEKVAREALAAACPHIPILGEEGGLDVVGDSEYMFMVDPIDGTRPFNAGAATSTVICALFNTRTRQFEASTIGEPATGRLWHADGERTHRYKLDPRTGDIEPQIVECRTWDGDINNNGTVLIDNFAPFSRTAPFSRELEYRETRAMLNGGNILELIEGFNEASVAIQNYGSNGLHHALVAHGGNTLAGAITTSMGGEWDTAGALAVLNAGGEAQGLRLNKKRKLEDRDPLDPFSFNMLVVANNGDSLRFLKRSLARAVHEN